MAAEVEAMRLGDRRRLEQALSALVDNAVKFTERGTVEIEATAEANRLRFTGRDTGVGMTEAQVDQGVRAVRADRRLRHAPIRGRRPGADGRQTHR